MYSAFQFFMNVYRYIFEQETQIHEWNMCFLCAPFTVARERGNEESRNRFSYFVSSDVNKERDSPLDSLPFSYQRTWRKFSGGTKAERHKTEGLSNCWDYYILCTPFHFIILNSSLMRFLGWCQVEVNLKTQ